MQKKELIVDDIEVDINNLFYAARNNGISLMLHDIFNFFKKYKFKVEVKVKWYENAYTTIISVVTKDNKYIRNIGLNREVQRYTIPGSYISNYSLNYINNSDHYNGKKPNKHQEMDDLMGSDEFKELIETSLKRCNYPFKYPFLSSI